MSGPLVILFGCQETVTPPPSEKSVVKANATVNGIPEAVQRVREASGRDKPVVCGTYEVKDGDETFTQKEIIRMGVINAKLSRLPDAKVSLGVDEVKTCEQARKFIQFMEDHPELEAFFEVPEAPHAERLHQVSLDSSKMRQPQEVKAPLEKATIRNSIGPTNRLGVVRISSINGIFVYCTGYMINHNAILTAAHCIDDFISSGNHAYVNSLEIHYYDPNSPNSPSSPRVIASGESGEIWVAPTYAGETDVQSDIGIIRSNANWHNTTIYDYVRVWNEDLANARYNHLYGQGYDGYSGNGLGTLRYEYMYIEGYGAYHYYTLAYNHRVCGGDSGGPQFRADGSNFVLGHMSNVEMASSGSQLCAAQGGQEKSMRLSPKLDWVAETLGVQCYYLHGYAVPVDYRQCFVSW
jgi:V8-like Glu-specific endopeptidase